jgi:hypothetical protein
MKASFALAIAVVALAGAPTLAASGSDMTHHHVRYARHHLQKPLPNAALGLRVAMAPGPPTSLPSLFGWLHIAPYPPGQGDADGLSRNVDDCNKGCIDGPP